jgi:hypothetical protein
MLSYLRKRICRHQGGITSVRQLKDESLGVGNERYLYVGVCKKCGAVVDLDRWPITGSLIAALLGGARSLLLLIAFVVALTWASEMIK